MRLLLDTHAILWFIEGDNALSPTARMAIESEQNSCFVSIGSLWEIAIKVSIGKLMQNVSEEDFKQLLIDNAIEILPLTLDHVQHVRTLPFFHRDPFDRMLISQASVEGLTILTRDSEFQSYQVPLLW